jgi:hypothetical protein
MREMEDFKVIRDALKELAGKSLTSVLIIDGKSLDSILKNEEITT